MVKILPGIILCSISHTHTFKYVNILVVIMGNSPSNIPLDFSNMFSLLDIALIEICIIQITIYRILSLNLVI